MQQHLAGRSTTIPGFPHSPHIDNHSAVSSSGSAQQAPSDVFSETHNFSSGGVSSIAPAQHTDARERCAPNKSSEALTTSTSPPFSPNVTDQDLQTWLSQKDLGDDLLRNVDLDDFDIMDDDELTGSNNNNIMDDKSRLGRTGTEMKAKILIPSAGACELEPAFNIKMTAKELLERCKGLGKNGVSNGSILGSTVPPPAPPEPPKVAK